MSTLKSSAEDLTLNADGSGNDVIIQSDGSTVAIIDSNKNLILGATAKTAHASYNLIQGNNYTLTEDVTAGASKATTWCYNAYTDAGNAWTYMNSDEASQIQQYNGQVTIATAGAGSAEGDITFTNKLAIANAGDVTVGNGDLIFGTAGKGICLGVTTNTDANTLDDYEEGTWTPVVTSTGGTYSNQAGMYTKIGRLVNIFAFVSGTSFTYSAATDLFNITGAPFSAVSAGYTGQAGSFYGKLNWNNSGSASTTDSIVTPTIAGTTLALNVNNSADADAGNARIKVDNNGAFYVQISLTYWV